MAMIECDRCGRDYSTKLMHRPRYVVKEVFDLGQQEVEDPLYFCPECNRELEQFMRIGGDSDGDDD